MAQSSKPTTKPPPAISAITVEGFKSIAEARTLEIRPLTILAGANSSGKSSMMQPLLLLKQTLEAQYDPGPLLLNGPNVKFTSASQFTTFTKSRSKHPEFSIELSLSDGESAKIGFRVDRKTRRLDLDYNEFTDKNKRFVLADTNSQAAPHDFSEFSSVFTSIFKEFTDQRARVEFKPHRNRCLFDLRVHKYPEVGLANETSKSSESITRISTPIVVSAGLILRAIHLPGLRGNPERLYHISATGPRYPGTFENYVASIIAEWETRQSAELRDLIGDLHSLGLTWKIEAKPVNDTQVELRVGRLKKKPRRGENDDLVSLADVGLGVSQTLPVLVALRAANPGQLVYIEQPEIHLHPRAQVAMAKVLAKAALRGVRVVVETHSSLLLLAVQTLVAEGFLPPDHVGLNWFIRDEDNGTTQIRAADLDEAGRFGDWPEDFADTALEAESRYLSAAEARLIGNGKDG